MLDLDALRSFIAFVDSGSFTHAAKLTFRTQSAISIQMKKLEATAGQCLFDKQGRNLVLTDQGRLLAGYARQMLSLHDAALSQLNAQNQYPELSIGCPDDYAEHILPQVLGLLNQHYPNLGFRILCHNSDSLRRMLDNNEIHAAILSCTANREEGHLLQHETGHWVHGGFPELLEREELPLILYQPECKFRSAALDGLEKQHRRYRIIGSSSSAVAIQGILKQGLAVSALAGASIGDELTIISPNQLPTLPSVDINLKVARQCHPLLDDTAAMELCQQFQQRTNKTV